MFRFYSTHTDPVRVTVVGEHKDGVLRIAVSRCSNKDNFYRKKGRMIAEGRLRKGKTWIEIYKPTCNTTDFLELAVGIAAEVKYTKKVY